MISAFDSGQKIFEAAFHRDTLAEVDIPELAALKPIPAIVASAEELDAKLTGGLVGTLIDPELVDYLNGFDDELDGRFALLDERDDPADV